MSITDYPESARADVLVNAETLLSTQWHPQSRPSLRWLREQQRRRTIPFIKISGKVFFRPAEVRAALERNFTVNGKTQGAHEFDRGSRR